MDKLLASRPIAIALSALMLIAGLALAVWALGHIPTSTAADVAAAATRAHSDRGVSGRRSRHREPIPGRPTPTTAPTAASSPTSRASRVLITLGRGVPTTLASRAVRHHLRYHVHHDHRQHGQRETPVGFRGYVATGHCARGGKPVYRELLPRPPASTRWRMNFAWTDLRGVAWRESDYDRIVVLTETMPAPIQALGDPGTNVFGVESVDTAVAESWALSPTLTLLPFETLVPSLKVLPIDGRNPVENANRFDPADYPLIATIYAKTGGDAAMLPAIDTLLAALPPGNRQDDKLTVLAMTGVTAMVRRTAEQMDIRGAEWPAEIVGPELAAADITHISNEVPFVEGCETNTDMANLNFCSKPEYLAALRACGVDIIGLTGNHQNDFGADAAYASLEFYEEEGLPVYGGGVNRDVAFAPLLLSTTATGRPSWGPTATAPTWPGPPISYPGSAPFDLAIMSATIRNFKEKDLADIVLPGFQYQESYDTTPLMDQRAGLQRWSAAPTSSRACRAMWPRARNSTTVTSSSTAWAISSSITWRTTTCARA
ncbi:MAG: CapA family protein [Caldilineaceae bacterium]